MPRLADHGSVVELPHHIQKRGHHSRVKRERRRQLQEQRASLISQAVGLSQKHAERFSRVVQPQFVGNRPRDLDREAKTRRSAITPLRVGGEGVWPVERRIDLCAIEPARVALEMRSSRVEANRRRPWNRPTRRADPNLRSVIDGHPCVRCARLRAARLDAERGREPWDTGPWRAATSLRARPASGLSLSRQLHHGRRRAAPAGCHRRHRVLGLRDARRRGAAARRFLRPIDDRAAAEPLPAFPLPVRAAIAQWAAVDSDAFAMALINEYRPGSPIGWHRDAPQYDIVAGISLLSACRMKFRPYRPPASTAPEGPRRSATHEIVLARRSAYLMTQESRQHMNITFRRSRSCATR